MNPKMYKENAASPFKGKGSERRKSLRRKSKKEHQKSKIQNVERSERQKFEKDQNVESLICLIFKF